MRASKGGLPCRVADPSNLAATMVVVAYVYILRCSDGSYYIGHTADLAARERTHNEGHGARFTGGARRRRTH
jgi:predicted GIY-YIG superfamily endonuclease